MSSTKYFALPVHINDSAIKKDDGQVYGRAHEMMFMVLDHYAELKKKLDEHLDMLPATDEELNEFKVWMDSMNMTFEVAIDLYWGLLGTLDEPEKAKKAKK